MSVLTTIARGDASRVSEPRRVLARTDQEWQTLWATHAGPGAQAPDVDMQSVTVAAVFAGEKPTPGYSVDIQLRDGALAVEEQQPAPGGILAQMITSPFHIVSVPKSTGDVTWAEAGDRGSGIGDQGSGIEDQGSGIQDQGFATPDPRSSTGLEPRTASALAYLAGPFSGVLILLAESTNQHVRFHAWQSIVGLGGLGLAILGSYLLAFVALFVSATAVTLMVGVATVIWIVLVLVWVICLFKAWSGERWKLPIVGDYAERLL
jgi:uncharacterized membrane protein